MTETGAFISGCEGTELSAAELDFFSRTRPWGLILFARNIENPGQVRRLVADFRKAVERPQAPVFIDQEGGRVQRLRPPHWRVWPPAMRFAELFGKSRIEALRAARLVTWLLGRELADLSASTWTAFLCSMFRWREVTKSSVTGLMAMIPLSSPHWDGPPWKD